LQDGADADVPCGSCTACCTASQFIHIEPDETETRSHLPSELLFPAPGLPEGHHLMGYDRDGRCPMFRDNTCTIYDYRPRACRIYDCRVFAASQVVPDDTTKARIVDRVQQWQFSFDSKDADLSQRSIAAAARYLTTHAEAVFGTTGSSATRDSLVAIDISQEFVRNGEIVEPDLAVVQAAVDRTRH
jgi:Fe-S-cluster containining protein